MFWEEAGVHETKREAWFSAAFGVVLWFPQMLFILPAGIISLVLRIVAAPFGGLDL